MKKEPHTELTIALMIETTEDKDSWTALLVTIYAGHAVGIVTCSAAILQGARTDTTWLVLSAVLFAMGATTAIISSVALRAFPIARLFEESRRVFDPLRVVVGCVILIASAIAFFCGCTTAVLALLRT